MRRLLLRYVYVYVKTSTKLLIFNSHKNAMQLISVPMFPYGVDWKCKTGNCKTGKCRTWKCRTWSWRTILQGWKMQDQKKEDQKQSGRKLEYHRSSCNKAKHSCTRRIKATDRWFNMLRKNNAKWSFKIRPAFSGPAFSEILVLQNSGPVFPGIHFQRSLYMHILLILLLSFDVMEWIGQ